MWGILCGPFACTYQSGITPTPVGNTKPHVAMLVHSRDHPHTCGEYTKESLIYRHSYFENSAIFITLLLKHTPAISDSQTINRLNNLAQLWSLASKTLPFLTSSSNYFLPLANPP